MDQHSRRPDDAPQQPDNLDAAEARRRLLRRSLGLAAPVALTLSSTPVSAGMCLSASAFVSVNTNMSRQPRGAEACSGYSPTYWAGSSYWPGNIRGTDKFHACLGKQVIDPRMFFKNSTSQNNGQPSMLEVLNVPSTVEAHVAAAWLNAQRFPGMAPPFGSPQAIVEVWANIVTHGGYYAPGNGRPAMTVAGTRQWLAQSWS